MRKNIALFNPISRLNMLPLIVLLGVSGPTQASNYQKILSAESSGKLYKMDNQGNPTDLVYLFKRKVRKTDSGVLIHKFYTSPEGKTVFEDKIHYNGVKFVSTNQKSFQTGEKGKLECKGKKVEFQYWDESGDLENDKQKSTYEFLFSDAIYPFLVKNWDSLVKGDSHDIRLPVIHRQETVGFTLTFDRFEGKDKEKTGVFKMKASSIFIRAIVNPLYFYISADKARDLRKVTGRAVPKIKVGKKWKEFDGILVFDRS